MKFLNRKAFLAISFAFTMAIKGTAGENPIDGASFAKLSTVASAELPAKAAELVKQAPVQNLKPTTIAVVKAAVGLNPAAAPAIVGSVAQATPAMAGTAAATAVALVPNQMIAIAKAAAAAAPTQAGAIVEAVCRLLPKYYQQIATAVSDVVPGAEKQILAGIAAALPELGDAIHQTLASDSGNLPSLSMVLAQLAQVQNATGTVALNSGASGNISGSPTPVIPVSNPPQGPANGPPLVPISTTPPGTDPGSGGQVPIGSRGYSAP